MNDSKIEIRPVKAWATLEDNTPIIDVLFESKQQAIDATSGEAEVCEVTIVPTAEFERMKNIAERKLEMKDFDVDNIEKNPWMKISTDCQKENERLREALKLIQSNCGLPNPLEAIHCVLNTASLALSPSKDKV